MVLSTVPAVEAATRTEFEAVSQLTCLKGGNWIGSAEVGGQRSLRLHKSNIENVSSWLKPPKARLQQFNQAWDMQKSKN